MATVNGTSGSDFIHVSGDGHVAPPGYIDNPGATNGDDTILTGAGNDTVFAGGGDDVINFLTNLNNGDQIDGGTGNDTVIETGSNASIAFVLNMVNVENFAMEGSSNFKLAATDLPLGQSLRVDGRLAPSTATLTLDASLVAGTLTFVSGAERDIFFTGGSGNDVFDAVGRPTDFLDLAGGAGNDTFNIGYDPEGGPGGSFDVNGGTGTNTMNLNAGLSPAAVGTDWGFSNIQQINFRAGFDYSIEVGGGSLIAGATLTLNGTALGAGDALNVVETGSVVGTLVVHGGAGNDQYTIQNIAVTAPDVVMITAGAGDDHITVGQLVAGDHIDGGTGSDVLALSGNYTLTFDGTTVSNIETITLAAGFTYTLGGLDNFVAANQTLTVDGSALSAGNVLTYDGSAETNGHLVLEGGAGNDVLTGGAQSDVLIGGLGNDTFDISHGGVDTVNGGDGNDIINAGAALTSADTIDGGAGNDTVELSGGYNIVLAGSTIENVENLVFAAGSDYTIALDQGNVAAGHTLTVDASVLGAGDVLHFNAHPDTDGRFVITGGAGNDVIAAGGVLDFITGGLGADIMRADPGGHTTFAYTSVAESTSTGYDTLQGFISTATDLIHLPFVPTLLAPVVGGTLSTATFDADLASAVGAAQLTVGNAVVYEPNAGDLAGRSFLIVDANGVAGYQASQDYVIQLGPGSATAVHFG